MSRHKPQIRLFVESPLQAGTSFALPEAQAHYVRHVMRREDGDSAALFNGRDGEWQATLRFTGKREVWVEAHEQLRPQPTMPELALAFAPIKSARLEYMLEKATELGASALWPVITEHTQMPRINAERWQAHLIEAAEQCERLDIPRLHAAEPLAQFLARFSDQSTAKPAPRLLFADEGGASSPIASVFAQPEWVRPAALCLLIGPEGGFSRRELDLLRGLPYATGVGLGPRVLRADTAALAALACAQAWLGDWDAAPRFTPSC